MAWWPPASVALALDIARSLVPLAGGLCFLMIAGIRNAWDMTLWIVIRDADAAAIVTTR